MIVHDVKIMGTFRKNLISRPFPVRFHQKTQNQISDGVLGEILHHRIHLRQIERKLCSLVVESLTVSWLLSFKWEFQFRKLRANYRAINLKCPEIENLGSEGIT